ncbi:Stage V sporulation-like protein, SpoVR [Nitrosococcus oceani ATCC 19707]|uniref:Stage V sporulation-like protein, SpoVR n=4 Tax=Nitrosococcus oceani TaxID=1229 RepID=Q3J886_NITOC|nr:SpoVR family protein [Nitrosococcus oceani]ABA58960.1 Stage V sporulation-like protein, SpoVR [Nitrosococcus oceani ATCC 19707]KFI18759.1 stage V sporulation protein R [Nitrosococcus oceani C-27]GEM18944.1 stage V sporulation protein R [Nitrosococcus oceani]
MASHWTIEDLKYWDDKIREKAEEFGLSCFPQEFEICDHTQMLGYMAYSGMPAHYPHWSYGKAYEKLQTLYEHGMSGLPYEMVINSNPALAYLVQENSLCLQILTIAHVYGHNDFFKNNFTFRDTQPELTLSNFKLRADRVRGYIEDPSIGLHKTERVLDAAHALSLQCSRNQAIRKLSASEQKEQVVAAAHPTHDPYQRLHKQPEYVEPDLNRFPLFPEEDILLFMRDNNLYLADWERDLLTIVHEQARYFIPQIETKIMNEGWASYWHHKLMNSIDLPQDLYLEFLVHHNQVVRPHPGDINPYYLGFKLWHDIFRHCQVSAEEEHVGKPRKGGREGIFQVREVDRDASFLRRFLTEELMREMDMFEYQPKGEALVISKVSDEEHWREIKTTLLKNVGMGSIPVIRIEDADYGRNRQLYLKHDHDGRDLQAEYAEKTLSHLYQLWGRDVWLETRMNDRKVCMGYGEDGFVQKTLGRFR